MSAMLDLPSGLVTFLFTDIEGSTRLAQLLGAEYRPVLAEHRQILRRALGAGDGVALFTEGDSVFAAFPDANAAMRACAEAQRALARIRGPTRTPAHGFGWVCTPGSPSRSPASTPRRRCTGPPGSRQPPTAARCSAPASTARLAADLPAASSPGRPRPLPAARLRRPGAPVPVGRRRAGARLPPPPHARRRAAQPARPGRQLRRTGGRAGRSCASCSTAAAWSTSSGRAAPARPGWRSRWPATLVPSLRDGVWFVDLAAVTDPYLVAVVGRRGARRTARAGPPDPGDARRVRRVAQPAAVAGHLRRPPAARSTPMVARLIGRRSGRAGAGHQPGAARCARASWCGGSRRWALPSADDVTPDAVALLVDRAEAARGGRVAGPEEMAHLLRVAQRLDGLPLALELAAARLRLFSAGQLADRLDDLLGTLDARQRPDRRVRHRDASAGTGTARSGPRSTGPTGRCRRARPRCCASCRSSPARSTSPPSSGSPAPSAVDRWPSWSTSRWSSVEAGADQGRRHLPDAATRSRRSRPGRWSRPARRRPPATGIWPGRCTWSNDLHTDAEGKPVTLSTYPLDQLAAEVRACLQLERHGRPDPRRPAPGRGARRLVARARPGPGGPALAATGCSRSCPSRARRCRRRSSPSAYHVFARHAGADGEYGEQLRLLVQAEEAAWRSGQASMIARVSACRGEALVALGREEEAERACRDVIDWARTRHVRRRGAAGGVHAWPSCCGGAGAWPRRPPNSAPPGPPPRPTPPSAAGAASTCCSAWSRCPGVT